MKRKGGGGCGSFLLFLVILILLLLLFWGRIKYIRSHPIPTEPPEEMEEGWFPSGTTLSVVLRAEEVRNVQKG